MPTEAEVWQCYTLCCWTTKLYKPVNLVRLDERTGNICFLAAEEIIIEIYPDGDWRYINE
uniref:DUF6888 domain-containing protein n=1 Tax=Gloeothece verrucosa (strain PCC 7822) TaxID=497965 RepID=E0UBE3_GLOV7|nr:conserved hypothetical protein [Gloeothece verrucosa PCC 7822]